jgi:hypothetical protein
MRYITRQLYMSMQGAEATWDEASRHWHEVCNAYQSELAAIKSRLPPGMRSSLVTLHDGIVTSAVRLRSDGVELCVDASNNSWDLAAAIVSNSSRSKKLMDWPKSLAMTGCMRKSIFILSAVLNIACCSGVQSFASLLTKSLLSYFREISKRKNRIEGFTRSDNSG